MISKIILFICAIACTALCLWQNVRQINRVDRVETERIAIASQDRQIMEALANTKAKLGASENEIPALKQSIALLQKIEFIDATLPAKPEETAKKEADSITEQEQKARGYRAHLVAQYAPFYYRTGLNNEQIDRLETMLTDHWQSTADIAAIAEEKKLKDEDSALADLRKSTDQTLNNAKIELLGEAGFQCLQDYERTLPARDFTAAVTENLYFTDAPLNADQAEKLTQMLADNSRSYQEGKKVDVTETDWGKVLEQMPSILSPKQRTAFSNSYNIFAGMPHSAEVFSKKFSKLFESLGTDPQKKE